MEVETLTPTRALLFMTPPGLVVTTRVERPPPSFTREPWKATLTVAWERGSERAAAMAQAIDRVVAEMLGPDACRLVRSGEIWAPLRDGDLERPDDARFRGRLFAEISGDVETLLDARRKPVRQLDLWNPTHLELAGCGSHVRARTHIFIASGTVKIQLAGTVAVIRSPPGWQAWDVDVVATS